MKQGLLICGHGTRHPHGLDEFAQLTRDIEEHLDDNIVRYGYLEFARPIIRDGLDALRHEGCAIVHALPAMLFAAGHVKNDIPSVLNNYALQHPSMRIILGRELGITSGMLRAAEARIRSSLASSPVSYHDTLLMVVGRGASDPDANSHIAKITRMLWEGMGFGWAESAFSGMTFPLVAPALEKAVKLGMKQIVVFPYMLFDGVLVQRIYHHTDLVAKQYPQTRFVKAPYLNNHPDVVSTFLQRLQEIHTPDNAMNCQLCKYRERIVGFEHDVGTAQMSHHDHAEGEQTHTHQQHTHHHPPYPHADHPLGPLSMSLYDKDMTKT
ncbi:MAG: sirohydrochlorin chelatase [Alphaproteobacteria bacterium GM7ARS4]|nr:sirohydrochlorin chelatase [Alphaproteobacteria bacterium GM7ARS4]